MDAENNINVKFSKVIKTLEKHLDFKRWGFEMTALQAFSSESLPYAIYQSKKCFVAYRWLQERSYTQPSISILYARLHAPLNDYYMIWNGQKCRCWHSDASLISFLDDLPPHQKASQDYFFRPRIIEDFYKNNEESDLGERAAKRTLLIWNHYGDRFFNLLDLQRPELWEKFSYFLKEFYEHQNQMRKQKDLQPFNFDPPLYMVC